VDRSFGDGGSVPVRTTPVDELCFRYREADAQPGPFGLQPGVLFLQDLDVPSVRRRRRGQTEVINIGEGETARDLAMKAGEVNDEQERGDWGALGRAHRDRGKHSGGTLI